MRILITLTGMFLTLSLAQAQNTFQALLKDEVTNEPLIGATALLTGFSLGASSDVNGKLMISSIPDDKRIISIKLKVQGSHSLPEPKGHAKIWLPV